MSNFNSQKNRRILVIDDNQAIHGDFRKIFRARDETGDALDLEAAELFGDTLVEEEGVVFEVDSAYQGQEGAEMVRDALDEGLPYAMAIVDMRMPPGWDGVKTTLKIWKIDPDVQIVICTAYSDHSWKDMLKAIGSGDRMIVLKKPFEPVEVFQMASMLTEKWWLQRQARQKMEDLESLVEERSGEVRRTNEDLVQKNEEIQNFYHTLSHELKTPLTAAREFISIVADGLVGELNETQAGYLNIARENCSRLAIYTDDLLDSTRLDTGKLRLSLKPVSLARLIRQVITIMQPLANRKDISLHEDMDANLGELVVDENRIMQILTHLFNNALKFTGEGGSIVAKLFRDPQRPEWVEIAVVDNGRGIPGDQLESIFDRYFQLEPTDAETVQGMGLGLFLCRELVGLHGGEIRVESEEGKGSTFTVSLPADLKAPELGMPDARAPLEGNGAGLYHSTPATAP